MKQVTKRLGILILGLMPCGTLLAQSGVGVRIWAYDYDADGQDGDGGFALGYVQFEDAIGTLIVEAGYGSVNVESDDLTRSELAVGFQASEDLIYYGAAFRAMFFERDVLDVNFLGPEISLGFEAPLGDSSIFPYLGGTLGWYFADGSGATGDISGSVLGYSLDGGFGIELSDVTFKIGARVQTLGDDGDELPEQEFSGPYVQISFDW